MRSLVFMICLVLLAGVARAREPDKEIEDFDELDLEELLNVVFTAAKHKQDIAESPSAVTVISREDIDNSGARTLPEVLRMVPSMDITLSSLFWYDVSSGGGWSVAGADNVLLLVDNREVTADIMGVQMWTSQHFSMDEVKRIEVVRGPGAALYGANAYSGVVHVFTFSPKEGPDAFVSVRGGEHGQRELNFRARRDFGSFSLAASAGYDQDDYFTARELAARQVVRGRLKGKVDLGSRVSLQLEGGAYQTNGSIQTGVGPVELHDLVHMYTSSSISFQDLTIKATYDRLEYNADFDFVVRLDELDLARIPPLEGHTDRVGIKAQHMVEGFHNRLIYGAEYVFNGYHSKPFIPRDQSEHRAGLFLQDELDLAELLRQLAGVSIPAVFLTAGLRYDDNSFTRRELSPRAALVCRPSRNHSLRIGYGHAFLKPKLFESRLHIELEDISGLGIDEVDWTDIEDLKNETVDSLELGYNGSFLGRRLDVRLNYSYNWYKNSVEFTAIKNEMEWIEIGPLRFPDLNGPGFGVRNRKHGYHGFTMDLSVAVRPTRYFRMFANASYHELIDEKSNKLWRYNPRWRIGSGADFKSHQGWFASIRAYITPAYRSKGKLPGSGMLESGKFTVWLGEAFLLNARAGRKLTTGSLELTLGLEGYNLLGSRFRETAGVDGVNQRDYGGERICRRIVLFLEGRI